LKIIQERTALKLLLERNGLLVSVTTKRRAFYLFLAPRYVGIKIAPTTDPDLGIVELSGYRINAIIENWSKLSRAKVAKARS
jgi:hypothetical protein